VPGIKIAMPSSPAEAKGLMKAAIRDPNPVVFLEHKRLYSVKGEPAPADEVQAAVEFAARLRLKRALPALRRRAFALWGLRSDAVAWHACVALAQLGDEQARRSILKRLDAWSYDARTLAVAAAGQAVLHEARDRIASFRRDPTRAAPEAVSEALRALDAQH
jgi:hypothetical protein